MASNIFCIIHKCFLFYTRWNESIWKCFIGNATLVRISVGGKFQVGTAEWYTENFAPTSYDEGLKSNLHKTGEWTWALVEANVFFIFASTEVTAVSCLNFSSFAGQDHLSSHNFSVTLRQMHFACIKVSSSCSGDFSRNLLMLPVTSFQGRQEALMLLFLGLKMDLNKLGVLSLPLFTARPLTSLRSDPLRHWRRKCGESESDRANARTSESNSGKQQMECRGEED